MDLWDHKFSSLNKLSKSNLKLVLVLALNSQLGLSLPKFKIRYNKWIVLLSKNLVVLLKVFNKHHLSKHPKFNSVAPSPQKQDLINIGKNHRLDNGKILQIKFSHTIHYLNL